MIKWLSSVVPSTALFCGVLGPKLRGPQGKVLSLRGGLLSKHDLMSMLVEILQQLS